MRFPASSSWVFAPELGRWQAAFEKHEAFKTGIKCAECLPPPTEPSAPHPSAATGWALGALALFYAL